MKKLLAIVLASLMVISLVPVTASADEVTSDITITSHEEHSGAYKVGDTASFTVTVTFNKDLTAEDHRGQLKIHLYDSTSLAALQKVSPDITLTDTIKYKLKGYTVDKGKLGAVVSQSNQEIQFNPASSEMLVKAGTQVTLTFESEKPLTADDMAKHRGNYIVVFTNKEQTQNVGAFVPTGRSVIVGTQEKGKLTVTNTVEDASDGQAADKNKLFTYRLELDDKSVSGEKSGVNFAAGVATFTLKNGDRKTFEDIPVTGFTITESDYGGYNVTYKAGSVSGEGAEAKGEIGADSTTQVTFTNTRMTSAEQAEYNAPTLTYHLNLPGVTEDANKHVFKDPDFIIGGQPGAYTYTYTIRELYAGANDANCLFSGVDNALIGGLTQGTYTHNRVTYYFLGWDTVENDDTSGNNLSDIDFIVTEFNHKVVNGKTTRSFNDPNPTLEITKNTDLYAVWSVNPGFAGYSLSKPNTNFNFTHDMELSDMTLGDNGYAKTGAYKYVVLEKAYPKNEGKYELTKDIPVADDGSTFLGWFNKKANVDDDPNIASVLAPGAEVTFGDTSNIYSMDAVWGSVSGVEDAAYMYDRSEHCIDISGLAAVITGGAYSDTELETYNKLFNTDNVKYTVKIDDTTVLNNVSLEDLESSSAINKKDVGVYKYEIIATLIIDDASAGKAATKGKSVPKYEREIGRLTATLSIIGGITVSKTVVGGDANQAFNFRLDLENTDGTWGYVINGETKTVSGTTAQETFSLKDGESIMVILTPETKYTVTEAKNDDYTAAVTGAAGVETTGGMKASGTIGEGGKNLISLEYTNTRKTGSLTIKNTTNLNGGTYGSDFTYTITSAGAAFESEKNYGAGVYVDDHTLTVTVAQNSQATVTGLPTADYTVAQTAPAAVPQWTWGDVKSGAGTPGGTADPTTGVGATLAGVAVADSQTTLVLFENVLTRKTGSLTIKKELTGDDVVGTPEFTFTIQAPAGVTFGNASDYGAGVSKDSNGNLTVTVAANNTVTVSNLPVGTYTVVETGKENYSLSGVAGGTQTTNGFTVTVGDGTTTAVTVTNKYTAPAPKTGSLRILKRVTGEDVNVRQDFTFRIYPQSGTPMAEGAVSGATAYAGYYEAKVTFGLGSNSVTVSGLPEGSYRVEELTSNLAPGLFADPIYDKATVEVRQNATADITVTNPVNTGTLTLSKTVVPDTGSTLPAGIGGKEFSFTVSLNLPAGVNSAAVTVNGVKQTVERTGEISVKLKKDGSVRIGNIPYGTTYSVKENLIGADEHFYSDKYTGNETDTLTSANVTVSCQNTYSKTATNTGTLRLRKVTQGQTDQTEFTFTVTFTAPADTTHEALFQVFKEEQGLDTNNSKTYTVKKGESLLIINIPVGTTYTVQETFNGIAAAKQPTEVAAEFESGTKETTDSITGTGLNIVARGTINADADGDQVTFYNRYLIDLVITKEVKGEGKPSANTEYVFTLEFSGFTADELDQLKNVMEITDATGTRSYDKLIEDFRADNKVTIYLTEEHPTATVNKVPSGRSHYNVEEINSCGAETVEVTVGTEKITGTSTGFKQMSPETAKVTFTNTFVIKTGKLTVKVEATGEGKKPEAGEKYTVHVELTDKNGDPVNGTYGGKEFKDGKADFQLGDGESVVLEDLPYGTKYTVTETDKLGADTVTGEVKTEREFVADTTVTVVNTYNRAPTGSLTIKKELTGDDVVGTPEFTFTIQAPAGVTFGNASDYGAGVSKDSNGNLTVTVAANNTVTVSNLPVGTYTVVETGKENYSLSGVAGGTQTTNGFTVTVGDGTATAVTVTNNYTAPAPKTGSLRILKKVTGEDVNVRQDFTFRIYPQNGTPMAEDGVSNATIHATEGYYEVKVSYGLSSNSVTVSGLPEGSYRVEELTSNLAPGLFADPIYDKATVEVRQNATADITVTNPVNTGTLTLSKTVVPDTGSTLPAGIGGKEFSFTVSLNLPAGVNSAAVTVNGVKQTVERTGEISVKLKKDGSVRIGNIPYGTTYSVKENLIGADEHFYSDKYTGNETDTLTSANVTVSCQNTYSKTATNTGTLRLRKVTQGQTDQTEFTFTVTFTPPVDTTHEDLFRVFKQEQGLDANNSKTYTVKKGESLLITNIPVGTTYTIQETFNGIAATKQPTEVAAEFESGTKETTDSISGTGLNIKAQGKIDRDADGDQVTFYNRYLIDLVITKEVKGEGKPSANTEYVFTLEFSGFTADELDQLKNVMEITDATGTRSYDKLIEDFRADNKVTIYLTEEHPTATVNKVPSGRSHYNVEEINSCGAETVEVTVGTEKITGTSTGFKQMSPETAKVTFTNTFVIKTGKLTVKVEATGEGKKPEAGEKYTVHVELTDKNGDPVNGTYGGKEFKDGKADFRLGDGESVVLENLPYGTKYTVTETDKLGADTVAGEVKTECELVGNTTVEIQNTYNKAPSGGGVTPPPTGGDVLNKAEHFGYIIGVPGKEVRPEQNITRAEIVTILFRLLTDEARQAYWGEDSGFTDVQKGVWYNHAVATLHNLGIIQGDGSGRFKPMEMITRAEVAAMVVRFREKSDSIKLENRFTDVAEGKWYTDEVLLADFYGLMEGDGSNRFKPEDKLTRAEAMTVFNRLLERKPHKDHLLPGMITWSDNMDTGRWYYAQIQEATNSHKCGQDVIIDGKVYETWSEITPMRDWAALEY